MFEGLHNYNRIMLGNLLENDYELIYASNGVEAIEQVKNNKDTLSLVLLDLIMPGMNGLEVLKQIKNDSVLKNLPVIVLTSDRESEVESLNIGASDFIPKPYPQHSVITARINRTIELSEDRMIINSTECDPLTELFNRKMPVERRFDRANMACDAVKNAISGNIGIYNSAIHEKELFDEQLIEDFRKAIEENQFKV